MGIEYKTTTYHTAEGNDNASFSWCELSAAHVPPTNGTVKRIAIQCRSNSSSSMTTDPVYLGLWERQDDGGLVLLGRSTNAVTQTIGTHSVWDFDSAIIRGKGLVLGLMSSPDSGWTNVNQLTFGARVKTNDDDGCVVYGGTGRLYITPDITFTVEYAEYTPDEPDPEPDPEPESSRRVIDIRQYWRPVVGETLEFNQIADCINPELNRMQSLVYDIIDENFISTASEYGVGRWESILGLVPETTDTLDDRKNRIVNYRTTKAPYTFRSVKRMIVSLAGDATTMTYDNEIDTLTITLEDKSKLADVNSLLDRVLPVHIVYNIK